MSEHNPLAAQRRKARHYGLQALYQWTLSGASPSDIEAEFRVDNDFQHTDGEYFNALLCGVIADVEALELVFEPALDRGLMTWTPLSGISFAWELSAEDRIDVPYKVVISEAVALAKKFAQRILIVTSMVLDKISRELRPWSVRKTINGEQ